MICSESFQHHKTLHRIVAAFKNGLYFEVISEYDTVKSNELAYYYLLRSFNALDDIAHIFKYVYSPDLTNKSDKIYEIPESRLSFITELEKYIYECFVSEVYSIKSIGQKIEFILKPNIFIFNKLHFLKDSLYGVKLSNIFYTYADYINHLGRVSLTFDIYKVATWLFPDAFYFRIKYAELAFINNDFSLCEQNVSHANHLLLYSGSEKMKILNTFTGLYETPPEKLIAQLKMIAIKIGFRIG